MRRVLMVSRVAPAFVAPMISCGLTSRYHVRRGGVAAGDRHA